MWPKHKQGIGTIAAPCFSPYISLTIVSVHSMPHWLYDVYFGNALYAYLWVVAGLVLSALVLNVCKRYLMQWLRQLSLVTATPLDDLVVGAIDRFLVPIGYLIINYVLIHRLVLPAWLSQGIRFVVVFATVVLAVRMINHTLHSGVVTMMRRRGENESRILQMSSMLLLVKALVWVLGLLVLLSNMGVNVAAALTGLGIGGIAIALATQNIFADLFSYFVIFFDKPFQIGDAITVNTSSGVVEKIGIKTTQVRSYDGQLLVVPNAELVKSPIQNFGHLQRRRVLFSIYLGPESSTQALASFSSYVEKLIVKEPEASFGHCMLRSITEKGLQYEVQYHLESSDYGLMLRTQDQLLLSLHQGQEAEGYVLIDKMPVAAAPEPKTGK